MCACYFAPNRLQFWGSFILHFDSQTVLTLSQGSDLRLAQVLRLRPPSEPGKYLHRTQRVPLHRRADGRGGWISTKGYTGLPMLPPACSASFPFMEKCYMYGHVGNPGRNHLQQMSVSGKAGCMFPSRSPVKSQAFGNGN